MAAMPETGRERQLSIALIRADGLRNYSDGALNWTIACKSPTELSAVTVILAGKLGPAKFAERKILYALLFPPKQGSIYNVLSATWSTDGLLAVFLCLGAMLVRADMAASIIMYSASWSLAISLKNARENPLSWPSVGRRLD
jgi:hypothetical protein